MIKALYLIRHKPTGFFMPEPTGSHGRGSSFWEPKKQAEYPRIFRHQRSAKSALIQWLRGEHHAVKKYEHDEFSGGGFWYTSGTDVKHKVTRCHKDMEIVEVYLTQNPCSALGLFERT